MRSEPESSGDVAGRLRDDHLTAVRGRADAGRHVHVQPDVAIVGAHRLAGMDPDRHSHLRRLRPLLRIQRALDVGGRRQGITGALEGEEDAVAGPVDLAAAVLGDRRPHQLANPGQHSSVLGSQRLEQQRRRLDVCEEEGHRAGRQRTCARVATRPAAPPVVRQHSRRARGPAAGSPARALGASARARCPSSSTSACRPSRYVVSASACLPER